MNLKPAEGIRTAASRDGLTERLPARLALLEPRDPDSPPGPSVWAAFLSRLLAGLFIVLVGAVAGLFLGGAVVFLLVKGEGDGALLAERLILGLAPIGGAGALFGLVASQRML
jgi:hypothetical protein